MADTVRWGILGCGRIARKFAAGLASAEGAVLAAAGSRSKENADAFGDEFSVPRRHGSYEELAADARLWRHIRIMPRFAGKESSRLAPYHERAPLVAFGDDVTVNNHSVTLPFQPWLPLDIRGSLVFEFRNYAPIGTQIIATFCGWTKPQRDRPW